MKEITLFNLDTQKNETLTANADGVIVVSGNYFINQSTNFANCLFVGKSIDDPEIKDVKILTRLSK